MKRLPSLHITEDRLIECLQEVFKDKTIEVFLDIPELAKEIIEKAKGKSATHRLLISSNDKTEKKIEKLRLTGRSEASLFAHTLLLVRRKMKHRGIKLIDPGHSDWVHIKEICSMANDFCQEFGLKPEVGYRKYIELGMSKMNLYSLFKFKGLHSAICNLYDAQLSIKLDDTPDITRDIYLCYKKIVEEKIGTVPNYESQPEKYMAFLKAKEACLNLGLKPSIYIKAQFAALEWISGYPEPNQLYGDKAIERATKYCFENNIQMGIKSKIDFRKIRGK